MLAVGAGVTLRSVLSLMIDILVGLIFLVDLRFMTRVCLLICFGFNP